MLTQPASASPTRNLFSRFRDQLKELELDFQLHKEDLIHGYQEQRDHIRQSYNQTSRSVNSHYRTIRTELGQDWREIRAELTYQKSLLQEDFRDFVDAGSQWRANVTSRRRSNDPNRCRSNSETSVSSHNSTDSDCSSQSSSSASTSSAASASSHLSSPSEIPPEEPTEYGNEIRAYERYLREESLVDRLNAQLQSHVGSLSMEMIGYYRDRPELKDYTLNKELPRMNYTVFTHEGQKLTTPEDIVAYAKTPTDALPGTTPVQDSLLWRAANQSIFGDVMTSLTDANCLVRPQYSSATLVNDVSVVLDFGRDQPHLTAECFVQVAIPGGDGEHLTLAGVLVAIYFCPMNKKLEARVLCISPSSPLNAEQLEGAVEEASRRK